MGPVLGLRGSASILVDSSTPASPLGFSNMWKQLQYENLFRTSADSAFLPSTCESTVKRSLSHPDTQDIDACLWCSSLLLSSSAWALGTNIACWFEVRAAGMHAITLKRRWPSKLLVAQMGSKLVCRRSLAQQLL